MFRRQRVAAKILPQQRVAHCGWSVMDLASLVSVVRRGAYARFQGLQTCGSVWHCPSCSARISEVRRRELNDALLAARSKGMLVALITLTTRHKAEDDLPTLLNALKKAKEHWHNSRTYKGHKANIRGAITATELTHGKNGWHPHFHVLMFINGPLDLLAFHQMKTALNDQWLASLDACGLSGNGAAFDWQDADKAGQYVAKWGAAEEMTLSAKKEGSEPEDTPAKTAGRHPFDLLRTAAVSPRDRALFFAYAIAFKGRRQLQWTPGLRDLLAVPETSDQAAAKPSDNPDEEAPATPEEALSKPEVSDEEAATIQPSNADEWLVSIDRADWPAVRKKGRAHILEAIEDAPALSPLQPVLDGLDQGPDVES